MLVLKAKPSRFCFLQFAYVSFVTKFYQLLMAYENLSLFEEQCTRLSFCRYFVLVGESEVKQSPKNWAFFRSVKIRYLVNDFTNKIRNIEEQTVPQESIAK